MAFPLINTPKRWNPPVLRKKMVLAEGARERRSRRGPLTVIGRVGPARPLATDG